MVDAMLYIIEYFNNNTELKNNILRTSKLINIAADADLNRRKVMQKLLKRNTTMLELLDIPLFEQMMINGEHGLNFDPKHLIKRFRGIFISDKRNMQLVIRPINKTYIAMYFRHIKGNYPSLL
jgi:hypothetical protein